MKEKEVKKSLTYKDAGVDIKKADELVGWIRKMVVGTHGDQVLGDFGDFGGLFTLLESTKDMKEPVLVASTDGVGTKLKIAFKLDKHNTVGIDLVAMCENDILVKGADSLFFLDYISMGEIIKETQIGIVEGVTKGCHMAQCALLGGETAEMPGMYTDNEYDLAGFSVGIVDRSKMIDGSLIEYGDKIIGIASSGLHSNGYSLVRRICFEELGLSVEDEVKELGKTLGEELLTPTYIYTGAIKALRAAIPTHGLANITGGGLPGNIKRILPNNCTAVIFEGSWPRQRIFDFLQSKGPVDESEMLRTFNCGIGFVVVVPRQFDERARERIEKMGYQAFVIGEIRARNGNEEQFKFVPIWG